MMYRVALIGAGYIGQNHIAAFRSMEDAKITAIICRNAEHGRRVAAEVGGACGYYPTLAEALTAGKIDIVDICTPTNLHEQYTIEAAKAGCHVLCEKPVTFTVESFDRMYAACRQAGVTFMVAQVARWWPEFMTMKQMIDDGALGNIHMIYEKRICQHPTWSTWHRDPSVSGGGLYDLNIHDIDYLYTLFGMPQSVYAIGWKSPTGCWNHVVTNLIWESGVKAVCETSLEMTGNFPFSIEFRGVGDKGTINYALTAGVNINDGEKGSNLMWYPAGEEATVPMQVEQTDMFAGEIRGFLDGIADASRLPVTAEQVRNVLRIITATKQSLEENRLVRLDG
ncbi:MAG: Gfo/Idh/MocA family oxidoreductase [Oscillospiraceae bacterium]|nr:Gfo/Idh/MocA family oxidoreductase [Oscillospiraceae bacterium]